MRGSVQLFASSQSLPRHAVRCLADARSAWQHADGALFPADFLGKRLRRFVVRVNDTCARGKSTANNRGGKKPHVRDVQNGLVTPHRPGKTTGEIALAYRPSSLSSLPLTRFPPATRPRPAPVPENRGRRWERVTMACLSVWLHDGGPVDSMPPTALRGSSVDSDYL